MLSVRIIPCLDVAEGRVVKGVKFQDLRDAGDPVESAKAYEKQGADELATAMHGMGRLGSDVWQRACKEDLVRRLRFVASRGSGRCLPGHHRLAVLGLLSRRNLGHWSLGYWSLGLLVLGLGGCFKPLPERPMPAHSDPASSVAPRSLAPPLARNPAGQPKRAGSYRCMAHPTVQLDRPGRCPLCQQRLHRDADGEAQ